MQSIFRSRSLSSPNSIRCQILKRVDRGALGVRAVELLDYSGSGSARYFLIPKRAKFPSLQSWHCMTSEAFITGEGKAG